MPQSLLFIALSIMMLISCQTTDKAIKPAAHYANLPTKSITIAADSSYILLSSKGTIIKIESGTFKVEKGKKITIEIKEAFNIQDMLLGGLATESNGKLLRSGGMIYINASSEGQQLALQKKISISIPSSSFEPGMQLFKGEIKPDSSIDWVDPQPLDTSPVAKNILLGKELYKANCANCHKPFNQFVGGALKGSFERAPDSNWVYKFIANPSLMIATDVYAKNLAEKFKPTIMTAFPQLKRKISMLFTII